MKKTTYLGLVAAVAVAAALVITFSHGCTSSKQIADQNKSDKLYEGKAAAVQSSPAPIMAKPKPIPGKSEEAKYGNVLYQRTNSKAKDIAYPACPAVGAPPSSGPGSPMYYLEGECSGTEEYKYRADNEFMAVTSNPLSTFSVDVDTASYSNIRRFLLKEHRLPPQDAVRVEECLNYFRYDYPTPDNDLPLRATMELAACPWNEKHDLLLIGLQAKKISKDKLPPSNFVFLIDTSGSMTSRMPLVKESMIMLAKEMRPSDRIAIVTYAGGAGLALPSTSGEDKKTILDKIASLEAGGSTAGAAGIRLAYNVATEHFIKTGNNRVILITDGDFNVGVSSEGELVRMIETERSKNIFLTVLGVGTGNFKDNKMQMLADKGNGNYIYLDGIGEAKKALVNEMGGNMFTIAKDVKIQLEFNPRFVKAYRLVGYEKRKLAERDFTDDTKDAGEVGVGHQVTALYELIPAGSDEKVIAPAPLEFQQTTIVSDKLVNFKLRWKQPKGDKSTEWVGFCTAEKAARPSANFRFAAAVAEFGMLLRDSKFRGDANWPEVIGLAQSADAPDPDGYRAEFVKMARAAEQLQGKKLSRKDG